MEFRTLHLEDKAAVNDVLLPLGRNDSALGFANLYSLTEKYGTQIALVWRLRVPAERCEVPRRAGQLVREAHG